MFSLEKHQSTAYDDSCNDTGGFGNGTGVCSMATTANIFCKLAATK